MTLVIPIELIFHILTFCDPKTLMVSTLVSRDFKREIEKRYKKYFDEEHIHIIKFEELIGEPSKVMKDLFNLLMLATLIKSSNISRTMIFRKLSTLWSKRVIGLPCTL